MKIVFFLGLLASSLIGCGGGGGGTASLALTGTAATGAPIAGATVNVRCANAIGSTTTASDGTYSLTVSSGVAPCLLQVEVKNGTGTVTDRFHGYASAAGVANVTPLTDVVLALALGQESLSNTFSAFNAATAETLKSAQSSGKMSSAWLAIKAQLTTTGIDASAIQSNPFTDAFKADAANIGTGHDAVLDAIQKNNLSRHILYLAGGGGATGGAAPSFVTSNATETAYFSNSYEAIDFGYVRNAVGSTGAGGRLNYSSNGNSYHLDSSNAVFQVGLINNSEVLLDRWLTVSEVGYKNVANGYPMSLLGANDVIRLGSIQEISLTGYKFSDVLPSAVLKNGATDGTFPVGSIGYEAKLTSLQDIYLMPNVGSLGLGSTKAQHFYDFHNTAATAVCIGDSNALVFTSLTQATQHPVLSRSGIDCVADTSTTIATLSVSSRMIGTNKRIFEFGSATVNVTDYDGVLFNYKGTKALRFFLDIQDASIFGLSQSVAFRAGYFFPTGSTGTRLIASGLRLNKTALNAVLKAKGQPEI
jgi:hypothetical protein